MMTRGYNKRIDKEALAIWASQDLPQSEIELVVRPCPFPGMNTLMLTIEKGASVVPIAYFRSATAALRFIAWMNGDPEPEPPMEIEAAEWIKAFLDPDAAKEAARARQEALGDDETKRYPVPKPKRRRGARRKDE